LRSKSTTCALLWLGLSAWSDSVALRVFKLSSLNILVPNWMNRRSWFYRHYCQFLPVFQVVEREPVALCHLLHYRQYFIAWGNYVPCRYVWCVASFFTNWFMFTGPVKQVKQMFAAKRWIATCVSVLCFLARIFQFNASPGTYFSSYWPSCSPPSRATV
jgi:hypothetical protein